MTNSFPRKAAMPNTLELLRPRLFTRVTFSLYDDFATIGPHAIWVAAISGEPDVTGWSGLEIRPPYINQVVGFGRDLDDV